MTAPLSMLGLSESDCDQIDAEVKALSDGELRAIIARELAGADREALEFVFGFLAGAFARSEGLSIAEGFRRMARSGAGTA